MKPAIEVRGIGKRYKINHKNKASYNTLKDDLANIIKRPLGLANIVEGKEEQFWALKDISFEVPKGEIFGIIGRNGSGKSTLLKILSRIVDPTEGSITLRGRTASLLEVGTGFHPELTGRENVYFNGSMLGMSRQEIGKKFDEIVAFSEVERFIDTPVKYYSSGMYVRLAFSVAAHLDPDILILDEVLSVGDAGFQAKSLKKITETMERGRTVLFVSHSMTAVQKLCSKGILLDNGHIKYIGDTDMIVDLYKDIVKPEQYSKELTKTRWENNGTIDDDYFIPIKTYITDAAGNEIDKPVKNNLDHFFKVEIDVKKSTDLLTIGYTVHNEYNTVIYVSTNKDVPKNSAYHLSQGKQTLISKIPKHLLNEGSYTISLFCGQHEKLQWAIEPESRLAAINYTVKGGLSDSPLWKLPRSGYAAPLLEWQINK
jgi:lipopolysaccharide transport system ATP-binding protein